jgi:hypothetical protein
MAGNYARDGSRDRISGTGGVGSGATDPTLERAWDDTLGRVDPADGRLDNVGSAGSADATTDACDANLERAAWVAWDPRLDRVGSAASGGACFEA